MAESPSATAKNAHPVTKSRLSELALDAAIELDRVFRTKEVVETPGTANFFQLLREQLDHDSHRVFKDQTLVPVYSLALSHSGKSSFVPRDNLARMLEEVLEKHDEVAELNDASVESRIAFLRDFCLSVHEALLYGLMGNRTSTIRNDERARYN